MSNAGNTKIIKKTVGKKSGADVWDQLYQLNRFVAKLPRPGMAEDGHTNEKLLENLAKGEVKFIVAGGIAVALNGFVRTTDDVDILVERTSQNIGRLLEALSSFGEGHARELTDADFDETEGAVRIIEDFPLDVFTVMGGKRYADLVGSTKTTSINGFNVTYLNAEALISIKERSKREKDQIDAAALRRSRREGRID